jgi:hypothetical protein
LTRRIRERREEKKRWAISGDFVCSIIGSACLAPPLYVHLGARSEKALRESLPHCISSLLLDNVIARVAQLDRASDSYYAIGQSEGCEFDPRRGLVLFSPVLRLWDGYSYLSNLIWYIEDGFKYMVSFSSRRFNQPNEI